MEINKAQTDVQSDSKASLLIKERYSALLDGELNDQELDALLKSEDDFNDWGTYGLIGDVLRSPDLALSQVNLQKQDDFITSFRSRLQQEPLVVAPRSLRKSSRQHPSHWGAWLAASGFAVLVAVGIIYNVYDAPSQSGLQVATGGNGSAGSSPQVPNTVENSVAVVQAAHQTVLGIEYNRPGFHVVSTSKGDVLRDSQLEPYVRAHQQFSYNPELTIPVHYVQQAVVIDNTVNSGQTKAVNRDQ